MTLRPGPPSSSRPDRDRVRPLAPDDDFGTYSPPPRRGPIAAVVAALGLLILVGVVGLGTPPGEEAATTQGTGPLASGDAEITTTTTTTTTLPPTLGEYAPLESPIFVVPDERDTLLYSWHPSAREAQWVALGSFPRQVDFDATGRWLAYIPDEDGDGAGDLWIGLGNGSQSPQWSGVTSAVWHPSFQGNLAWTGPGLDGASGYGIRIGGVESRTGTLVDAGFFVPLSARDCVKAWGQWGFAVEPCDGSEQLTVYSPAGVLTAVVDTDLISASASGRFLVRGTTGDFEVLDSDLATVAALDLEPDADLLLIPDGTQVLEVGLSGSRTRVRSFLVDRAGGRSVSVTGSGRLIDLSGDQRFAVLHMPDDGDVVLVDWESGATFRIPGGWPRVAAVFVP